VQDRLFKVPRCYLEQESEVFGNMFQLPVSEDAIADGTSDSHPLHLDGVNKDEFRQLLRVMHPR